MVDDPRDALECFGSAPVDLLAIGPFVVRRGRMYDGREAPGHVRAHEHPAPATGQPHGSSHGEAAV